MESRWRNIFKTKRVNFKFRLNSLNQLQEVPVDSWCSKQPESAKMHLALFLRSDSVFCCESSQHSHIRGSLVFASEREPTYRISCHGVVPTSNRCVHNR